MRILRTVSRGAIRGLMELRMSSFNGERRAEDIAPYLCLLHLEGLSLSHQAHCAWSA